LLELAREWAEKDKTTSQAVEATQLANRMNVVAAGIAIGMRDWPGVMDGLAGPAELGFTAAEVEAMEVVAAYPNTANPGPG
jgi:hypothetical protein